MLTLIKNFYLWNQDTFGTRLYTIFSENLLEKMNLEINIIKIKKEKMDNILKKSMHQKYPSNGIHGYILHQIK